jgi:[acyl-carrier-protein] S-malonyltransferase
LTRACLLFSGQGVQERGMCRGLWKLPAARAALERLAPLGGDIEAVTTEMEDGALAMTFNAQRAIHAHHVGHWLAFKEKNPGFALDGAVGHSVGIVAALVAAEAMSVEDSAVFVRERAQAFADVCAGLSEPHGLAAIACDRVEPEEIEAEPGLTLALHNTTRKGIVGGRSVDLEAFARKAVDQGWDVRVQRLKVQGPYHTPVFEPCRERLAAALDRIEIRRPKAPVFMGTSGAAETEPARIKRLLAEQPSARELHLHAVRAAYDAGCRSFLEVASKTQPIHWIGEQLVESDGKPYPGVKCRAVRTEEL